MVGIVNHEHEVVSYRVEVKIDGVNSNGGGGGAGHHLLPRPVVVPAAADYGS